MRVEPTAPPIKEQNKHERSRAARLASTRALALVAFFVGAAIVIAHRPFNHRESGDPAIYDYIAQSILRGQMPYRDVIDPKTPLSMYLSAAAMSAGEGVGVRDLIAVRWLHVLMVASLAAVTFLVGLAYFGDRVAAALAFLIALMTDSFSLFMIGGTQPKLPLILFGMLTLLSIAKGKPLWAGCASMLAALCWQPGLMFTAVALLIFSRYLTSWRDLRAVKVLIGAAIPLAVLVVYFYFNGALNDLWSWTLVYPYTVFAPESSQPVTRSLANFLRVARSTFQWDLVVALAALAGFIIYGAARAQARIRHKENLQSEDLFRDAIIYPPVIYFSFCMINFQGGPDLIPFFPFIGLFAAFFIVEVGRMLAKDSPRLKGVASVGAMVIIIILILVRAATYKTGKRTLEAQDKEIQTLASYLGPEDKIYVHGPAEILVLLGRANLNKYIALDTGADNYIAAQKPGGFGDLLSEIEAEKPKVVALTRLRNVRHRGELREWVAAHYDRLPLARFKGVYLRRPDDIQPVK